MVWKSVFKRSSGAAKYLQSGFKLSWQIKYQFHKLCHFLKPIKLIKCIFLVLYKILQDLHWYLEEYLLAVQLGELSFAWFYFWNIRIMHFDRLFSIISTHSGKPKSSIVYNWYNFIYYFDQNKEPKNVLQKKSSFYSKVSR